MHNAFRIWGWLLGLALLLPLAAVAADSPAVSSDTTLDNLMAAYNGECNAQAKYAQFAEKAKAEGYLRVAKLFTAVALSESIRAAKDAKVISSLKGTAVPVLGRIKVGTTKENLQAALAGETAEIEKIYPGFIQQAELEKQAGAARSFGGAKAIAAIHVQWFQQALKELRTWKADGEFYTCQVCGNVVNKLDFEYCPVCKAPRNEFVQAK
jgi:rubrerythrin